MPMNKKDPKKVFNVDVFTEHKQRRVTVKGAVENKGDSTAYLKELAALYKNFYGFVVDVDRMKCERDLPVGEKFRFAFPERDMPINCYFTEVTVSKFSRSGSSSSDGISLFT
jgi:hypothetical protein